MAEGKKEGDKKGVEFTLGLTCCASPAGQGMAYFTVKSFCSDQKNKFLLNALLN